MYLKKIKGMLSQVVHEPRILRMEANAVTINLRRVGLTAETEHVVIVFRIYLSIYMPFCLLTIDITGSINTVLVPFGFMFVLCVSKYPGNGINIINYVTNDPFYNPF